MAASRKKAVIRSLDGSLTWGYVPSSHFVHKQEVEVMDPAGRASALKIEDIRYIAYVRDFNMDDASDPERLGRRTFQARPRMEGLWLKLQFTDGEVVEGLTYLDLGFLDSLLQDGGLAITPPDARSNTHRLFIPRTALASIEVLGWITTATRPKPAKPSPMDAQGGLFDR